MHLITHVVLLFIAIGFPLYGICATPVSSDSIPPGWDYPSDFDQSQLPDPEWWQQFGDTTLDSLISYGITNNYDIAMSARRVEIAHLTMNTAKSGYMPQLAISAGWIKDRTSGSISRYNPHSGTDDYWNAGLNMSWEIDLFGKIHESVKNKKGLWQASKAEYAGTIVSVCAGIASAYINLRMYQEQLALAEAHKDSQWKVVKITEARHEAGIASMLDVAQAKTVYYSTCATIPELKTAIHNSINAIAILIGVFPDEIESKLNSPGSMPDYRQIIRTGVPADLLRRRPDIAAAEKELSAYAAELGLAKKDFLPTLTLNGSIGTSAHHAGDLFTGKSFTYTIAPTLSWTVFDGMSRRYNTLSARQQMETGIENYNLTVLTAVKEADNAMCSYVNTIERIDAIDQTVSQCKKAMELSLDLYKRGLSPFTDVVDSQISLLEYQTQYISARGTALSALISLYEALGGGWNASDM